MSSATATAISAMTNTLRVRARWRSPVVRPDPSRSGIATSVREACRAGINPTSAAATVVASTVNTRALTSTRV